MSLVRGGGFIAFGPNDIGESWTQAGIEAFAGIGGTMVCFNPYWMYNNNLAPGNLQSNVGEWYPTSELLTAIGWAQNAGLQVALKPMIDPLHSDSNGSTYRGNLNPGANAAAFMADYITFLTPYAELAEAGVTKALDLFFVGCELTYLVNNYTSYWVGSGGVFPTSRGIFTGPTSYAGYPTDSQLIWEACDFLCVDFYPQLVTPVVTASAASTFSAAVGATISSIPLDAPLSGPMAAGYLTLFAASGATQQFYTPGAAASATTISVTPAHAQYLFGAYAYVSGPTPVSITGTDDVPTLEAGLTIANPVTSGSTGWGSGSYVAQLAEWSAANSNKQVIFSETGFTSQSGCASQVSTNRTDSVVVTQGSSVVQDTSILASDFGRLVFGYGIPAQTYVGATSIGTEFLLVNSAGSPVAATGNGSSITVATPAPDQQAAAVQALVNVFEGGDYPWYKGLIFWGWFCHYDQINDGNTGYNQYGQEAATTLSSIWLTSSGGSTMASSFPASVDVLPDPTALTADAGDPAHPAHHALHDAENDGIVAVQNYALKLSAILVWNSTTSSYPTRPSGAPDGQVTWIGPHLPNGATANDPWVNTSGVAGGV